MSRSRHSRRTTHRGLIVDNVDNRAAEMAEDPQGYFERALAEALEEVDAEHKASLERIERHGDALPA